MNNNDTELLSQALKRQNERAARMKMPDDMEQRVMERINSPRAFAPPRLYPAIAAIAASIVLLLTLLPMFTDTPKQPIAQQQAMCLVGPYDSIVKRMEPEKKLYRAHVQSVQSLNTKCTEPMYKTKSALKAKPKAREIPDTLGDGIWQRRENVLLALQMLAECEAGGEQRQRNAVVEAAFLSTPRPHELQLVVSETGDYQVVADDQQPSVIEL